MLSKCNFNYNFFFHPLKLNSLSQKALSIVTIVALSVFTRGIYAIAFACVNWHDYDHDFQYVPSVQTKPSLKTETKSSLKETDPSEFGPLIVKKSHGLKFQRKEVKKALKVENSDEESNITKVELIKQKHCKQLSLFEEWAKCDKWKSIHSAHYDWWMFPVERPSSGYGTAFAVSKEDVETLKADDQFMENYRRAIHLVVQAWGWDLEKGEAILVADPFKSGQRWTGYGVRLAKMSDSLRLFGETELHQKLKQFFNLHCLPQQDEVRISDLSWLKKTLGDEE